jgi:hypothetical protein
MNTKNQTKLILGVFTAAVTSSMLFASLTKHHQTTATSVQSQITDGSGPVPPPTEHGNLLLADGSGPVPPPVRSENVVLADGSGPVPPPDQSANFLQADGSGPVPPPVHPNRSLNFLRA